MFVTLYLLSLILVLCTSIKMKSWQGMISLPPVNLQRKTLRRLSPAALLRKPLVSVTSFCWITTHRWGSGHTVNRLVNRKFCHGLCSFFHGTANTTPHHSTYFTLRITRTLYYLQRGSQNTAWTPLLEAATISQLSDEELWRRVEVLTLILAASC